jgi:hypothetical protein
VFGDQLVVDLNLIDETGRNQQESKRAIAQRERRENPN